MCVCLYDGVSGWIRQVTLDTHDKSDVCGYFQCVCVCVCVCVFCSALWSVHTACALLFIQLRWWCFDCGDYPPSRDVILCNSITSAVGCGSGWAEANSPGVWGFEVTWPGITLVPRHLLTVWRELGFTGDAAVLQRDKEAVLALLFPLRPVWSLLLFRGSAGNNLRWKVI